MNDTFGLSGQFFNTPQEGAFSFPNYDSWDPVAQKKKALDRCMNSLQLDAGWFGGNSVDNEFLMNPFRGQQAVPSSGGDLFEMNQCEDQMLTGPAKSSGFYFGDCNSSFNDGFPISPLLDGHDEIVLESSLGFREYDAPESKFQPLESPVADRILGSANNRSGSATVLDRDCRIPSACELLDRQGAIPIPSDQFNSNQIISPTSALSENEAKPVEGAAIQTPVAPVVITDFYQDLSQVFAGSEILGQKYFIKGSQFDGCDTEPCCLRTPLCTSSLKIEVSSTEMSILHWVFGSNMPKSWE